MYNFREDLILEENLGNINSNLKRPIVTSNSRRLQKRLERRGGPIGKAVRARRSAELSGDEEATKAAVEREEALRGLTKKAKQRANQKAEIKGVGGTRRHSVRTHLFPSDSSKRYIAYRGEYLTPEQEAREARASRAGYFGTGKKLLSKDPKKIRKDAALRKMSRTPVSSDNFGKFAKENLKEMYYFVLDHLLVEGYADTYEHADAIFQIMSEEWFEDILLNG